MFFLLSAASIFGQGVILSPCLKAIQGGRNLWGQGWGKWSSCGKLGSFSCTIAVTAGGVPWQQSRLLLRGWGGGGGIRGDVDRSDRW